jgi:hypothetical protein
MNSDGDNVYTKIVHLDRTYNFVIETFLISNHPRAQIIDITLRSKIQIFDLKIMLIIWARR